MIFDNGKVTYAENEKSPGEVTVRAVLSCKMAENTNTNVGLRC